MKSNDLFKRIRDEIDNMPVVDLHTHIRMNSPNAKNLAEILFYHFVSFELRSSGADVSQDLPNFAHPLPKDEEKVEKILVKYIPALKNIENTGTYQALYNIFRDLYEFDLRTLTPKNYKILYDKVKKTSSDDNWTENVLQNRCKVETLVSTNYEGKPESRWIEKGLFSPSPERGFLGPVKEDLLKGKSLEELLDNLFGEYLSCGILSVTGGLEANFDIYEPGATEEKRLLNKWLKGGEYPVWKDSQLANLVATKVFKALNKKGMSWVIAVGTAVSPDFSPLLPAQTILQINHSLIPNICKALHSYPKVKLLTLVNSLALSQELCIAARMIPNIYPLGIQWHNFYPVYVERIIRERLETIPMTRNIGFISDAYSTEWFYGKLSIYRQALAKVLTQKIEESVYSEELALRIAKRWLYNNPKEVYFG